MKAYKVFCDDDDHGQTVVFAERSSKASKYANDETCDCEFLDRHVRRAAEFDKYAPGPVATANYLAEGWFWLCTDCERQCYADDSPIITGGGRVFCSLECVRKTVEHFRQRFGDGGCHESIKELIADAELVLTP